MSFFRKEFSNWGRPFIISDNFLTSPSSEKANLNIWTQSDLERYIGTTVHITFYSFFPQFWPCHRKKAMVDHHIVCSSMFCVYSWDGFLERKHRRWRALDTIWISCKNNFIINRSYTLYSNQNLTLI